MLLSTPAIWSAKAIFHGAFTSYMDDQRERTKVEGGIYEKLDKLASQFEQMCANHWDDRRYFDEQLDTFRVRLEKIDASILTVYNATEKRGKTL